MSLGHILIVDDEESIRQSLEGILRDEGFTTSQAADGDEALEILRREAPDVVLLDVWLPGLNGIQALQAARKLRGDLEVIMMSGHANIETAVKATKLGAFDFVEKPLSLEQVVRTVNLALRQQRLIRENAELQGRLDRAAELIGRSQALLKLRQAIESAASAKGSIVIFGEVGTGRELTARLIQDRRSGIGHPFLRVDCAPPEGGAPEPEESLCRRLFGYAGSSGEVKAGALEAAKNGALYLNAAERLDPETASRLASTLREGRFHRDGVRRSLPLKAWVIFSTTVDIEKTPIEDVLGKELAEQVGGDPVRVPPLRERWEDIRSLVDHFLSQFCSNRGVRRPVIEEPALEAMEKFHWPENIKGLKNVVEGLAVSGNGEVLRLSDLPREIQGIPEEEPQSGASVQVPEAWEREHICGLLQRHKGNLRKTAAQLGISEGSLRSKISAYGLGVSRPPEGRGVTQRTLGKSVLLGGQGLHSGLKTGLILSPLPPDSGIRIGSITTEESFPAHLDYVVSTDNATTLQKGAIRVRTIEHLMAALHAFGITNVLIRVTDEIPIMDGSARAFCRLIEEAGVVDQEARIEPVRVSSPLEVEKKRANGHSATLRIEPHSELVIDFQLVLPEPIGEQRFTFTLDRPESFRDAIAPARTFGLIRDVEEQERRGLAGGGRLDNVILLDEGRVVNTKLRFPDEFVRHKILDVVGDLFLLGRPVLGKVTACMSGHTENIGLLRKLCVQ
ncbi:MAG: UDP-3-O-[3-hydroxymyristoyl] N-acetylglucosamine deacetylase [Candidatus Tectomicrobia bacterium]|nr:UDP-3-O-[3-hydroxymyristoyl] N-acetylglucosamine deacetylase [Candidatus Tectomicrobia bacterium]